MNKPEFLPDIRVPFTERYDNFIGGEWVAPRAGKYFDNVSPVTGKVVCKIARSDASDVEAALDAARAAKDAWGRTSVVERALILNRIADRMEANLERLAVAETWDNGKPIRETRAADLPLAIDHFRYFAGVVRGQEGTIGEIDQDTVAYHFHEPLGVVGQIIPWNFPLLMACWKLAPALAAGNCVVLKPAEQTPASIMVWAELVSDLHRPWPAAITRCGSSRKRFLGPWSRSRPSRPTRRRSPSPMTRSMASAPGSGAAMPTVATGSAAPSIPAGSGPTATTPIRPMQRSAATSSRASGARRTR
jgi:Aldehyde dehydrogenase family